MTKEEYNNIPVHYCTQCLSLKVKCVPYLEDVEYCDECNSTNIRVTHIHNWEEIYKKKYGTNFLNQE